MDNIFGETAGKILRAVDDNAGWLTSLGGEAITQRRNSQGRSVKQILGHLVDSASNNHQRMVRLQYNEELVFPDYTRDNDRWIAIQDYQNAGWERLVELWRYYNLHLAGIVEVADISCADNYWHDGDGSKVTLGEMVGSYYSHLVMHLEEIHGLAE